jgi:Zn-dependent protease/CBS domain-containing protein
MFGTPVRFHFTFWLFAVWLVVLGFGGKQSVAGSVVYIASIFASILLHELGHALTARRYGVRTEEIVMLPLGGVARHARGLRAPEEFWVALAGPLVNFVIGSAILGWVYARGGSVSLAQWTQVDDVNLAPRLATANLVLAFFNLLPTFPMDGGRVFRSLLALRRPHEEATRLTARLGIGLAALMGLYGLLSANFVLVFVAFFIYVGAMQESISSTAAVLMRGAPVSAAMITDFRTLNHSDTIRDAAQLLLATSQQDFPVLGGGEVVGLLNRTALMRAMATEGPDAYVAGAMDREYLRLRPDMELAEAAARLSARGNCALVLDSGGLAGMLTSENLSEFLLLSRIRRSRKEFESRRMDSE